MDILIQNRLLCANRSLRSYLVVVSTDIKLGNGNLQKNLTGLTQPSLADTFAAGSSGGVWRSSDDFCFG